MSSKIPRTRRLQWLLEPLEDEPSFFQKPMFGFQAAYLFGKLVLVLAEDEEPWNGVLVCTSREFHSTLMNDYPALQPHSVLGKWLYLAQALDGFEVTAQQLVQQVAEKDPRIGVEPRVRRKKATGKK